MTENSKSLLPFQKKFVTISFYENLSITFERALAYDRDSTFQWALTKSGRPRYGSSESPTAPI